MNPAANVFHAAREQRRMLELLTDITEGRGTMEHIELLEKLADTISATALVWSGQNGGFTGYQYAQSISVMSILPMSWIKNVRQASARR